VISTHWVGSLGTCFYHFSHTNPFNLRWVQLGGWNSNLLPSDSVPWDHLLLFPTQATIIISEWVQLGGWNSNLLPSDSVPWDLLLLFPTQATIIISKFVQLGGRASDLHPPGGVPWDLFLLFSLTNHYYFRVGSAWRPGQ
jgi:hypothetical protein